MTTLHRYVAPDILSRNAERAMVQSTGGPVAGLDEVGRGPWAGPVVACAVVLPDGLSNDIAEGLRDSKALSKSRREVLSEWLVATPAVLIGFGEATVDEIDQVNILQASFLAMRRAVAALPSLPAGALVDGNRDPGLGLPTELIVKGDSKEMAIAAASILAKVRRDRMMARLGNDFPDYFWDRNSGYGTKQHRDALDRLGVTPHHRKSFAPIAKILISNNKI